MGGKFEGEVVVMEVFYRIAGSLIQAICLAIASTKKRIIKTLSMPQVIKGNESAEGFDDAFGLWKNRDISLETIRNKAWGRM